MDEKKMFACPIEVLRLINVVSEKTNELNEYQMKLKECEKKVSKKIDEINATLNEMQQHFQL